MSGIRKNLYRGSFYGEAGLKDSRGRRVPAGSYLVQRGQGLYFRYHVPSDLAAHLKLKEVRYALSAAPTRRDARRMAKELGVLLKSAMDKARQDIKERGWTGMDNARIRELIHDYFEETLHEDLVWRLGKDRPFTVDELEAEEIGLSDSFYRIEDDQEIRRVDIARVRPQVEALLSTKGVTDIGAESQEFKALCLEMLKVQRALLLILGARANGNPEREMELRDKYTRLLFGTDPESVYNPTGSQDPKVSKKNIRLSESITAFLTMKQSDEITTRSMKDLTFSLRLLVDLTGDPLLHEINHEVMKRYWERLPMWPRNKEKMPQYREKTPEELMEMEIPREARISRATIKKHLIWVKQWGRWAAEWGNWEKDYTAPLKVGTKASKLPHEERNPFTQQDLVKIFNMPGYQQDTHKLPYMFWLPVLGLFTGARAGELAQLDLDDITQEEQGVWCINIQTSEKGSDARKRLKTATAKRKVPLHDFLVKDLRLLDYASALRRVGSTRLWPEIPYRNHSYSKVPSMWFQKVISKLGLKTDAHQVAFHSFRHTLITHLLKEQGVNQDAVSELVGHSRYGQTGGRYANPYPPAKLKELAVDHIDFRIDLSHLTRSRYVSMPEEVAAETVGAKKASTQKGKRK